VSVPRVSAYSTTRPETIVVTMPASALNSGKVIIATPPIVVMPTPGVAFASGSLLASLSQTVINDFGGQQQLTLTLSDDTFSDALTSNVSAAVALEVLHGIQSLPNGAGIWEMTVRPAINVSALQVLSPQRLTVTLPQVTSYRLSEPETLLVMLPAVAVLSNQSIVAEPSFNIKPAAASVTLLTALGGANETALRPAVDIYAPRPTVTLILMGNAWYPSNGNLSVPGATIKLLQSLFSLQSELHGWNSRVLPVLTSQIGCDAAL
jgi:hypothetical protein